MNTQTQHLINVVKELIDNNEPPPANCSCHLNPPCGDCETFSGFRDDIAQVRHAIAEVEKLDKL